MAAKKKLGVRALFFLVSVLTLIATCVRYPGGAQSAPQEAPASGLELVGQSRLDGGQYADIWVHNGFAYLGTRSCGNGVKVVDVSNPASPQLLRTLLTSDMSTYEDVVVIRAKTAAFQGDLLAVGLQSCGDIGAHGVQFFDLTNPRQPVQLGFLDTGQNTRGVHELFMFQRDDRLLALLAVPNSEQRGAGGDFRIIDATDPRNPRQVADWGIISKLGPQPGSVFCHSAWASQDGNTAYLSYWDAGAVMLDISEPAEPKYLGKTTYPQGEDGNAHSAWPVPGRSLLIVNDEDFSVSGAIVRVTEPAALASQMNATELASTRHMCAGEVNAEVVYVGKGCKARHYSRDVRGKIVLADSHGCSGPKKAARAQEAGAAAIVIALTNSFTDSTGNRAAIPGVFLNSGLDGNAIRTAVESGQSVRMRLTGDPLRNTWGYTRIYDVTDPASPAQLARFTTPRSLECPPPTPTGWYTVHNPFLVGDTLYLSWYADGVRVVDISDGANPREIASWVPPGLGSVWGVYVQDDLVFLSDINGGLHVLRHVR